MTQAFPLQWPAGWPRAKSRKSATFKSTDNRGWKVEVTVAGACRRLQEQLDLLRASYVTLSTNLEPRLDGQPRSGQREPADPGAAVYFRLLGQDVALACDKWDRVADNIVAIAKHIEALRGMERWGVGTAAQAFAGYQALPAPEQWWEVLGIHADADPLQINAAYRAKARTAHPDQGGSDAAMARLNAARDRGLNR
jgi:hypothetical protein